MIHDELNVFRNIFRAPMFLWILLLEAALQVHPSLHPCALFACLRPHEASIQCFYCLQQWFRPVGLCLHASAASEERRSCHVDYVTQRTCQQPFLYGVRQDNAHQAGSGRGVACVPASQVVIMVTPVGTFFKVDTQNWQEWLFAIALGAGSLLVALAVKLISRRALQHHSLHAAEIIALPCTNKPCKPWISSEGFGRTPGSFAACNAAKTVPACRSPAECRPLMPLPACTDPRCLPGPPAQIAVPRSRSVHAAASRRGRAGKF